ncbi:homocysteine-responsive endoplasmic reticulum-resident ubiquitin-like domain member 2 protein isoform X3 [Bufo bufo]|uniref:homocysteine-responsive endoplasmic reticulum-resident ubiquitin-like domain member 2 protein isoform X3 n=1 Tax=Bufo bufo TaxID=8384 RepID=UPI001ABE5E3C|nr:homocysteine-responsive endoplasmic reticulum-resident ubiquitin-like domain member 2 protein isoform X3 [Bufo bufo]
MDQSVMDNPVTLVIKAPNQKYDDQTINCFLDWTVEKLKTHLSKVYPSKPNLEHSGSYLPVSASRDMPSTPSNSRTEENLRHRHNPHTYTDAMHNHSFPYNRQPSVGNLPAQAPPAGFPAYSAFTPLQMMWWQQVYARQYYMQYQAAASSQVLPGNVAQPPAIPTVNPERPPPNPPRAAPNIAPEANQNVQMNAQGGPVMNEEDINRDWLDWMYTVSRAAILLSIVYFYSSFSRFVMVMGAMILVYMHQAGWFPFRQEDGQPQVREEADVIQDRENNNDLLEMEHRMDEGIQEDGAEERTDDAPAVAHPGLVASAWSFITTFFTSLIPEGPPQVVN